MSVDLQPVSDQVKTAFEQWLLLIKLFRKSEAMISRAMSRLDRGDRLRTAAPPVAIGEKAYILAEASRYETEALTYLSLVPEYHEFFSLEIIKVRTQIEGGLDNE
jgi:hypothetical protein